MILPLISLGQPILVAQAQKPTVSLEVNVKGDVPADLNAALKDEIEKAGFTLAPQGSMGSFVLKVFVEVSIQREFARVEISSVSGDKAEFQSQNASNGRSGGPGHYIGYLALLRNKSIASERAAKAARELVSKKLSPRAIASQAASPAPTNANNEQGTGGAEAKKAGEFDFQDLKVIYQPPPVPYPSVAKMARLQGTVQAELMIDPEGVPEEAILISGYPIFVDAVLLDGMSWRFEPPVVNGQKVSSRFKLVRVFSLR